MKTFLYSLLALGALVVTGSAQVVQPPRMGDVKLEKVSPAVVKSPEYTITGGQNKRYKPGEWLEVEVEFETKTEMIDELTFAYKMLVNGKLLVGEVSHVNIPKGREHYSVAYVAPRSLESLMGGKNLNAAAIGGIWVEVNHQGQVLGSLGTVRTAVPNAAQVQGMILNKSMTPFSLLYWDRYEALKPVNR